MSPVTILAKTILRYWEDLMSDNGAIWEESRKVLLAELFRSKQSKTNKAFKIAYLYAHLFWGSGNDYEEGRDY